MTKQTVLMSILNITPDSFSDGGKYKSDEDIIHTVKDMIDHGVGIIDIGGQSTRPGSKLIKESEELDRIIPIINLILRNFPDISISVDTFYSTVARSVLQLGAKWINDISGGRFDPYIFSVASEFSVPIVICHSRGNFNTMHGNYSYNNIVNDIIYDLKNSTELALRSGVLENNIIWDPGIGFSKDNLQNIDILSKLKLFCDKSRYPVLVGPSRKSFIGFLTNEANPIKRLDGTSAVVSKCVFSGVDIVRVHDYKNISRVLKVCNALS